MEERNPKKSKALIITFIIVLALLIGGYFLITKTKILSSSGAVGKVFAPLLGTSKQKAVSTIQVAEKTPSETTSETPGETTQNNTTPSNITSEWGTPGMNSFPNPNSGTQNKYVPPTPNKTTKQCNDGKDNDGDKLIDSLDAGCHTDFDATNNSSYDSTLNDESAEGVTKKTTPTPPQCPSLALVFTDKEKADLAELTRQYYHIAATLHTNDDILAEQSAKKSYQDLVMKAKTLTNQCHDEVDIKKTYKGPTARRENPYFKSASDMSYLYEGETNNYGLGEPITQSLMNITNLIKKDSVTTSSESSVAYLKKYIDNVIGPNYEDGIALPELPCFVHIKADWISSEPITYYNNKNDGNRLTAASYSNGGSSVLPFLDAVDKVQFAYCNNPLVSVKGTGAYNNYNNWYYVADLVKAGTDLMTYGRQVHQHSCEGLVDYTGQTDGVLARVNNLLPSDSKFEISTSVGGSNSNNSGGITIGQGDSGPGGIENPSGSGDTGATFHAQSESEFKAYTYAANKRFGYISTSSSGTHVYYSENNTSGHRSYPFWKTSENMTSQEKTACNDMYGLKLLLKKTSDITTLKNYITPTILKLCGNSGNSKIEDIGYTQLQSCLESYISRPGSPSTSKYGLATIYRDQDEPNVGSLGEKDRNVVTDASYTIIPLPGFTVDNAASTNAHYIKLGLYDNLVAKDPHFGTDYFKDLEGMFNIW